MAIIIATLHTLVATYGATQVTVGFITILFIAAVGFGTSK